MSNEFDDGGPAFPVDCVWDDRNMPLYGVQTGNAQGWATGLSIRDYFAAKAMQAGHSNIGFNGRDMAEIAEWAYRVADAMLRARKVRP